MFLFFPPLEERAFQQQLRRRPGEVPYGVAAGFFSKKNPSAAVVVAGRLSIIFISIKEYPQQTLLLLAA
jgi:hypothetical protein